MAKEIPLWINDVLDGKSKEEVIQGLLDNQQVNRTAEYLRAQELAGEYLEQGEDIPQRLIEAIQHLGRQESGFIGLTCHEASHSMRRHRSNSLLDENLPSA